MLMFTPRCRKARNGSCTTTRRLLRLRRRDSRVSAKNHEPLHRASFPKFLLRRLIRTLTEAGIPYSREVSLVWLPLNRIAREPLDV